MASQRDNSLISVIGDEDTVTGFLLAGIGNVDAKRRSNFFIVDKDSQTSAIEDTFKSFTSRNDISVVLINQHIAEEIRYLIDNYKQTIPAVLEIPSKNHPYDPSKDSILRRAKGMFSAD
eukprot:Nk52_evm8s598 gene=Nk52_evmTU8s598